MLCKYALICFVEHCVVDQWCVFFFYKLHSIAAVVAEIICRLGQETEQYEMCINYSVSKVICMRYALWAAVFFRVIPCCRIPDYVTLRLRFSEIRVHVASTEI